MRLDQPAKRIDRLVPGDVVRARGRGMDRGENAEVVENVVVFPAEFPGCHDTHRLVVRFGDGRTERFACYDHDTIWLGTSPTGRVPARRGTEGEQR